MIDEGAVGRIAALYVYPVKGCGAITLDRATLEPMGLGHDRRWMVVDAEAGTFLSQRVAPTMALIRPAIDQAALTLTLPDGTSVALPLDDRGADRLVALRQERLRVVEPSPDANAVLSRFLGRAVRLVRFPATAERPCDPAVAPPGSRVAFADGFSALVTSRGSLDALNDAIRARGGGPVPMSRFRPNIVIEGPPAGAEDRARRLAVEGGPVLDLVSRCERCVVTTIDQATGERAGKEPLATLAVRRADKTTGAAWFGQNAVPRLGPGDTAAIALRQACRLLG